MKVRYLVTILVCTVVLLLLCACGVNPAKKEEFASKEQFLEDMAKGLSDRQTHQDFSKTRTEEEMTIYFQTLVSFELEQIEKYETKTFEDPLFHELAHAYIDACQIQRLAVQNYPKEDLHDLWLSAGTIRSSIVSEMYENHDLPLSDRLAAAFFSD